MKELVLQLMGGALVILAATELVLMAWGRRGLVLRWRRCFNACTLRPWWVTLWVGFILVLLLAAPGVAGMESGLLA